MSKKVGVVFSFKVAPENDNKVEEIFEGLFKAMQEEEFPTGDVITYTLFRDPSELGKWMMFEYFTEAGSDAHSTGPKVIGWGNQLVDIMIEPYIRILLDPVDVRGCGGAITNVKGI